MLDMMHNPTMATNRITHFPWQASQVTSRSLPRNAMACYAKRHFPTEDFQVRPITELP
jgi:hypothetical protein